MGRKREHKSEEKQAEHVPKPKAYSYLRFSTPEQAMGDSRRRQTDLALKYAASHGLELDDNLRMTDEGISAFHAKNLRHGALGVFLRAIDDGLVPAGSFLLVESLDRISRADPWEAMPIFQQIINAGVSIVTLQDERVWNRQEIRNNPFRILESLLDMIRAHNESVTKSRRVREAWASKRKRAAREPLTARAPAWLRLDYADRKSPQWAVLEDRAEVVRRIFKMAEKGAGQETIAATLNKEGVPTFGRGKMWHRSYVQKMLSGDAVVGVYHPHTIEHDASNKKSRVPSSGGPIANYYPRIIDDELFNNVRAMRLDGRRQPSTKPNRKPAHMLSGLARCSLCGGSMTRVYKGRKGGKPKLVCATAKIAGGCKYVSVSVEDVERAISDNVGFLTGTAPSGDEHLDAKLEQLGVVRAAIDEMIENVVTAIETGGNSRTLQDRLRALEASKDEAAKEYEAVVEKIATASRESVLKRLDKFETLVGSDADKAEINAALRGVVNAVVVDADNGRLLFQWEHGGESVLTFAWPSEN